MLMSAQFCPSAAPTKDRRNPDETIMPDKLITKLVDAEPAPAKGRKLLYDTEVKGFAAAIYAPTRRNRSGNRSFLLNYRINGVERFYTIGSRPAWTVDAARIEARELRRRVDRGEDIAVEKRERRDAPTVKDLIDRYVADHLPKKSSNPHRVGDEKRMLAEIGDQIGLTRKVADVHFGDIEALHKRITASGRPVRANRILAIASKMFSLALKPCAGETKPWRDAAQGNPCKGVGRNLETAKERFFSAAELAALSDALNSDAPGSAADCIRLIMLSGCRPGEAMSASWKEFDAEPGYWVKPSAHVKQRKTHKAPLNPAALELLARLRVKRDAGKSKSPWVFPGQNRPSAPLQQIWSVWYRARELATVALWGASDNEAIAAVVADLRTSLGREPTVKECRTEAALRDVKLPIGLLDTRPYDLRHTFASVGAGGGLSLAIIGRLLGHTQSRTTQRYAHLADDPLREATAKIGSVIAGAGKGTDVVKLRKGT
jgi:integrase